MSAFGRIHYRFDQHDKVQKCSHAAIGLWTLCNAKCRRHHTSGLVKAEWVEGFEDEAQELCKARLWHEAEGGYSFHDYDDWNSDENRGSVAAELVAKHIDPAQPYSVREQLVNKAAELLDEGTEATILADALTRWGIKPGAGVSLLPHLVSDALRANATAGIDTLLRAAWKTGDLTPLAAKGYTFVCPDIPSDLNVQQTRAFVHKAKREFLKKLKEEL